MAEQTKGGVWDAKELGVLWKRKSAKGETFLTGKLNLKSQGFDKDISVVAFTNKQKKKDTHPDIRLYFSEPKQTTADKPAPKKAVASTPPPQDDDLI